MKQSRYKMFCQCLLMLLLAYGTTAFEPQCCGQNEFVNQYYEEKGNDTVIIANCIDNSDNFNNLSITCKNKNEPFVFDLKIFTSDPVIDGNKLMLDLHGEKQIAETGGYCFGEESSEVSNTSETVAVVVMCVIRLEPDNQMDILGICKVLSGIFYLLTAVIYLLLPQLRDLLGKCLINFCAALGIGLLCFAIVNYVPISEAEFAHCAARGFFAYFFLVAGFFWSNVISIQTYRSLSVPPSPKTEWRTFLYYTAYAWGVPVLLTIIMAIVNYHPGGHAKPGIGIGSCWFINTTQRWYYLYSIMLLLIIANIILFILVASRLWQKTNFQSNHASDIRYRFALTLKLFFIMGIPWILEMIITAFGTENKIWYVLDIIQMLQGILMFILLVVFRKQAIKAMHERGWFLCLSDTVSKYLVKTGDQEADAVAQTDFQDLSTIDK